MATDLPISTSPLSMKLDWSFLNTKGNPHPGDGRPVITPHLMRLASRSSALLKQQQQKHSVHLSSLYPPGNQPSASASSGFPITNFSGSPSTNSSILSTSGSSFSHPLQLPSQASTQRFLKAFQNLKQSGLFDTPLTTNLPFSNEISSNSQAADNIDKTRQNILEIPKLASTDSLNSPKISTSSLPFEPDPLLWDGLRLRYERLAASLIDDAISDKFRVVTSQAFEADHREWEKEKAAFINRFDSEKYRFLEKFANNDFSPKFDGDYQEDSSNRRFSPGLYEENTSKFYNSNYQEDLSKSPQNPRPDHPIPQFNSTEALTGSTFKTSQKHPFLHNDSLYKLGLNRSNRNIQMPSSRPIDATSQDINYLPATEEEVLFLEYLYQPDLDMTTSNQKLYLPSIPNLFNVHAQHPSLPEMNGLWDLINTWTSQNAYPQPSLKAWIHQVIYILESQYTRDQLDHLHTVTQGAVASNTLEGIEKVIAFNELNKPDNITNINPENYWMLAYTACRCGDIHSLYTMAGYLKSPVFSIDGAPPEFTTVCRLLSLLCINKEVIGQHISISEIMTNSNQSRGSLIEKLIMSFKPKDTNISPHLKLLLSLIEPNLWASVDISKTCLNATQEDYIWYKLRSIYTHIDNQNEVSLRASLQSLISQIRNFGSEVFDGPPSSTEINVLASNSYRLSFSHMLMYCGAIGEALSVLQQLNPSLKRVCVLLLLYISQFESNSKFNLNLDIGPYSDRNILIQKMMQLGFSSTPLSLKFLYLKVIPFNYKYPIFNEIVNTSFDEISTNEMIGKASVDTNEAKLIMGYLPLYLFDEKNIQASRALISVAYETIANLALNKLNFNTAFKCFYFIDDEFRSKDVLEMMLVDSNFEVFETISENQLALQEIYLLYYEIAIDKWKYGSLTNLAMTYYRLSFYYFLTSRRFLIALDWLNKHDLLNPNLLRNSMGDEPAIFTKFLCALAYCFSNLLYEENIVALMRHISLRQIETYIYFTEALYPNDPSKLTQARSVFKNCLNRLQIHSEINQQIK